MKQLALQEILLEKYEEAKHKNPAYSRRSFSNSIGLSAGALSEILNGRRKVSSELAKKIIYRLDLSTKQRSLLISCFEDEPTINSHSPHQLLTAEHFQLLSDWHYFAILGLFDIKDFKSDPLWISQRLGISLRKTKVALEKLRQINAIRVTAEGKYSLNNIFWTSSDDVSDAFIRRTHKQGLKLAYKLIDSTPVKQRDYTTLIFPLSPENLPKVKKLVRKFYDSLNLICDSDKQSELYQICIQLFPLTKVELTQNKFFN